METDIGYPKDLLAAFLVLILDSLSFLLSLFLSFSFLFGGL